MVSGTGLCVWLGCSGAVIVLRGKGGKKEEAGMSVWGVEEWKVLECSRYVCVGICERFRCA